MGHVIWLGITWLRAGAGHLGEDIRGCWLSSLPFPFLTALFLLIAGIMVHPRPVLSHSLLRPAAVDPLPGQCQEPPPPIVVTDEAEHEEEYEVEYIADARRFRRKIQYLVKWSGYDHPTWEPLEHLRNAADTVQIFHERYPDKPRPGRRR